MWRFAGNEDKESVENLQKRVDTQRDETDVVQYCIDVRDPFVLKKCHTGDELKKAVAVDSIVTRRENKKAKTKEYEVRLKNSVEHTLRSEERRGGKECVSTGRSRWSPNH